MIHAQITPIGFWAYEGMLDTKAGDTVRASLVVHDPEELSMHVPILMLVPCCDDSFIDAASGIPIREKEARRIHKMPFIWRYPLDVLNTTCIQSCADRWESASSKVEFKRAIWDSHCRIQFVGAIQ